MDDSEILFTDIEFLQYIIESHGKSFNKHGSSLLWLSMGFYDILYQHMRSHRKQQDPTEDHDILLHTIWIHGVLQKPIMNREEVDIYVISWHCVVSNGVYRKPWIVVKRHKVLKNIIESHGKSLCRHELCLLSGFPWDSMIYCNNTWDYTESNKILQNTMIYFFIPYESMNYNKSHHE